MQPSLSLFLFVLALVLFLLSAVRVPEPPRLNLQSAGLFCWLLGTMLIGQR